MADKKNDQNKKILHSLKATPITLLMAFIFGIFGGVVGVRIFPDRVTSLNTTSNQQKIVSSQSELIASIAKNINPSVVSIVTKKTTTSYDPFYSIFGGQSSQSTTGAGTGIILSSDGVVVTNKHVVPEGTNDISITTSNGKTYDKVTVLARDPRSNYDVAFLKISGVNDLKPAKLGDSSKMQVGDSVVAIGNALGEFQNTVTSGIISGLGRPIIAGNTASGSVESLNNLFQTDAAMNSGNSGGPLVNMNSEVIGINTAVAGDAQNIGFSIPINDIKSQIGSVLKSGKLKVPYLGVRYVPLNEALKNRYDLPVNDGAWLKTADVDQAVINGSPADKAGLKENDIITKIGSQKIDEQNTLSAVLGKYQVGDEVQITYVRDGKTHTTKTKLEAAPTGLQSR